MELLRPEVGTGDFKTAAIPVQNIIPLAFKENSSIREDLLEDLILIDENEN